MKTAVYSVRTYETDFLTMENDGHHFLLIDKPLSMDTVGLAAGCEAVCLFVSDDASAAVVDALADLGVRYIALRSAGYNNVNLEQAKIRGIQVARVSDYSPFSVAEHTVLMILALGRHLIEASQRVCCHNFSLDGLTGFDLHDKTVGLIGTGKIGRQVARILHGFGCRVLAYDKVEDAELKLRSQVHYVSMDELLQRCEIVSLHLPLTAETREIINSEALAKMKTGAMLINTARGALLSSNGVLAALESGKLGYLGLDVYDKENGLFFEDHSHDESIDPIMEKLLALPNVLITAHQGFLTDTSLRNIAEETICNLDDFENGRGTNNNLN